VATLAQGEIAAQSPARRCARWLAVVLLLALAGLVFEHWRGERALRVWKAKMVAQGEIFEARKLWPPPSAGSVQFSNQLAGAVHGLPAGLNKYAGNVSGVLLDETYHGRRGSQEPWPALGYQPAGARTWEDLDATVRQAQPALRALHQMLKDPPLDMGCDIVKQFENLSLPNYVNVRRGAQALQAAALDDLHQGNLAGALDDLEALLAFGRLYAEDPHLVSLMIRVAILGLSMDVCWDALQDPGWTEPQLARFQQACEANDPMPRIPRTLEAERAARHHDLSWFRSHSYEDWIARYQEVFQAFGSKLPARHVAPPVRLWRQWVFHPVWRRAWVDQEELVYLRQTQTELMALRHATHHHSWLQLKQELAASYQGFRPPAANWRFYLSLPLSDHLCEVVGSKSSILGPVYPYPDYSRAWWAAFRNLTQYEMVITAVALKRYGLRHGKIPPDLASLVPGFLAAVPRDLIDGKPLRYRSNADGSFVLYSVGEDGLDDGGNPYPEIAPRSEQGYSAWSGRDWVWPQAVAVKALSQR
jgi:hypothetical protein